MQMLTVTVLRSLGLLAAGAFAWSFAEYVIHRGMHHLRGKGMPSREHLVHHALGGDNPGKPFLSWLGIAVVGAVLLVPAGLLLGASQFDSAVQGLALYAGWLVGYGFYERVHDGSHAYAPRGRYTAWVRRHHFHHHHGHPMSNHGVTSPLWDKVFGTLEVPPVIRVPRRQAMRWLLDDAGTVRGEFAADYELVGPADADGRMAAIDRARAFANLAPLAG